MSRLTAKLGASALLCVATLHAQADDTLAKIRASKTITIAHREASLPFSYLDDNKKPVGYALDLCLKITDAVRRELKLPQLTVAYLPVSSSSRIPAITDGQADLECGSTTNNAERRKLVAFTIPYFIAGTRMMVRADSGIKNWADLRDKRVVTTKGTTTVKLLNDRDKVRGLNVKLVEGKDHDESFSLVETGSADAFPMDDVLLFGQRANAKNPAGFTVVGDLLSTEPYAIMLRKDDAPFQALVNREMSRIVQDGELFKLYDKWFKNPIPPRGINLNMPMSHLLRDSLRFPSDKVGN